MEEYIGIILKRIDYKDSSKIIYMYTKSGLKSFIVHGANKLSSPYLRLTETLSHVSVFASGKNLMVLSDATLLNDYQPIKKDLDKYTYVLHIFELIYSLSESNFDHEKLFGFFLKILAYVESTEAYIPYIYMFEAKLLYLLGVNPLFKQCVICGKKESLSFSVKEGGMCCSEHFNDYSKYSSETISLFQTLYYYDLQKPDVISANISQLKELRILLDNYYSFHLNIETKSRAVLKGLIGY